MSDVTIVISSKILIPLVFIIKSLALASFVVFARECEKEVYVLLTLVGASILIWAIFEVLYYKMLI